MNDFKWTTSMNSSLFYGLDIFRYAYMARPMPSRKSFARPMPSKAQGEHSFWNQLRAQLDEVPGAARAFFLQLVTLVNKGLRWP